MALAAATDPTTFDTGSETLRRELDAWAGSGRIATLWWRDDDAVAPVPALERLLALRARLDVPLALAVIPARQERALADRLAGESEVRVLQHGYAHTNFAPEGERRIELDASRPAEYVIADIAVGTQALAGYARALPVLVPPWNRIAPHLVPMLPELGLRGLSTLGARPRPEPVRGLAQNNVHIDLLDWRAGGVFAGAGACLAAAAGHLAARRTGAADGNEATGLMTHHAAMDEPAWAFVEAFVRLTAAHPAVQWLGADALFGGV